MSDMDSSVLADDSSDGITNIILLIALLRNAMTAQCSSYLSKFFITIIPKFTALAALVGPADKEALCVDTAVAWATAPRAQLGIERAPPTVQKSTASHRYNDSRQ
jgi:hypothetical protein